MKTLKVAVAATALLLASAGSQAVVPYTPPEFVESEWTEIGMGSYEPGVFDYFGGEYTGNIPCKMYKNVSDENEIWVEPVVSEELQAELDAQETGLPPAGPFILHIGDPKKVWTTPIWTLHPMIFCFYQLVPEIMGIQGSEIYYATKEGLKISFPANCFIITTMPTGTPTSNIAGTFAVNLPDPSGVTEIETEESSETVFYDMYGMKEKTPQPGKVYIMKSGNKTKKIIF